MSNKCNALESSPNHPPNPVHGKIVFHETVPAVKKVRNPWLEFFTSLPTHVNIQVSGCRWSISRQPASTVPGTVLGIHVKQPLCFERGHGLLRGEFGSLEVVTRWKFLYRRMHGLHWVNKRGAIWEKGEIVMDGFPDKDLYLPREGVRSVCQLSLSWAWVWSLVGELRSHKSRGAAKYKFKNTIMQNWLKPQ